MSDDVRRTLSGASHDICVCVYVTYGWEDSTWIFEIWWFIKTKKSLLSELRNLWVVLSVAVKDSGGRWHTHLGVLPAPRPPTGRGSATSRPAKCHAWSCRCRAWSPREEVHAHCRARESRAAPCCSADVRFMQCVSPRQDSCVAAQGGEWFGLEVPPTRKTPLMVYSLTWVRHSRPWNKTKMCEYTLPSGRSSANTTGTWRKTENITDENRKHSRTNLAPPPPSEKWRSTKVSHAR